MTIVFVRYDACASKQYRLQLSTTSIYQHLDPPSNMRFSRCLSAAAGSSLLGRAAVESRVSAVVFALKGAPAVPHMIPHAFSTNSAKGEIMIL